MEQDPDKGLCVFRDGVSSRNRACLVSNICTAGHSRTAQALDDNWGLTGE